VVGEVDVDPLHEFRDGDTQSVERISNPGAVLGLATVIRFALSRQP
jgi:hypothetical protein